MADAKQNVDIQVSGSDEQVSGFLEYFDEVTPSAVARTSDVAEIKIRRGQDIVSRHLAPAQSDKERDAPGLAVFSSVISLYTSRHEISVRGLPTGANKAERCVSQCAVWDRCFLGYPYEAVEGIRTTCSNGSVVYTELSQSTFGAVCDSAGIEINCVNE